MHSAAHPPLACAELEIEAFLQIAALSAEEQFELRVLTQQHQAKVQLRNTKADEHPTVSFLVWLFTPPTKQSGRTAYIIHRVLTIPIR